jgi:hypothetical protein
MQLYNKPSVTVPRNHSSLFNAMIYPFTRTIIYGTIWYQGKEYVFIYYKNSLFHLMNKGEANIGRNAYRYTCSFAKMIQYWREIWNQHVTEWFYFRPRSSGKKLGFGRKY